ncbi:MAG: DUF3455 domain-containing protein [Pseudorhodoplanes sp.]
MTNKTSLLAVAAAMLSTCAIAADAPDAIAVKDQALVATLHAQGAQVYECSADDAGKLVWKFREPIATLLLSGKTVGRHYAGPHWEMADGSVVGAKVSGSAPGATRNDIALLRLDVASHAGKGQLDEVTTIQRLNTQGGVAEGACPKAGTFLSVSYAADYAFYRKRN